MLEAPERQAAAGHCPVLIVEDDADLREMMAQLEKILQEDGPIVQPVWRAIFTFMDKRVQGFKVHPTLYIFGHQLAIST